MSSPDLLAELGFWASHRFFGINECFKTRRTKEHGTQETDRSGAQNDRIVGITYFGGRDPFTDPVGMLVMAASPGQTGLDLPNLEEGFFRDGKGLRKDTDVPEFGGNGVHVFFIVHHHFGHKTVQAVDPSFFESARNAKILPPHFTGDA